MRNKIIIILILSMLVNLCSCSSKTADIDSNNVRGTLIAGYTTQLTGDFWSNKWGNNTVDAVVRELIHGYNTVTYKKEYDKYDFDYNVIKEIDITTNPDKSKTYKITINDNLYWNDKIKITALDYVFAILLNSNSVINEMSIDNTYGLYYKGYNEYASGETNIFEGVRLIDTYTFSVTISSDYLPYYYELSMVSVEPVPVHVILPNSRIIDDGYGVQIICDNTQEALYEAILNPESGYRYFPKVTCGPYNLESYSIITHVAVLRYNPMYVGDYNGQVPGIEKIIIKKTSAENEIDELISGTVDILPAVSGIVGIEGGLKASDSGKINSFSYPSNGCGGLLLNCSYGSTESVNVRQAIACCIDKNQIVRQYSGGYANLVYSLYGIGQWMYEKEAKEINLVFDKYSYDLKRAKELIIRDGWIYNSRGQNFRENVDKVRYKLIDDVMIPLEIKHMYTADNEIANIVASMLKSNLEQIGFKYEYSIVDYKTLYDNIYYADNLYNMFSASIDFTPIFDPYYNYIADENYFSTTNINHIKNSDLALLAHQLRTTNVSNTELYRKRWFYFQKKWNKVLPSIPIYSDMYYCFYSTNIINYEASSNWNFQKAILYAKFR